MQLNNHNDHDLLELVSAGNREAFTQLYQRYAPSLSNYVQLFTRSKEDTEEILQEVFIKLWQRKEQLTEIEVLPAYLNRMTRNMVLNYLKAVKLKYQVTELEDGEAGETADHRLLFAQYLGIAHDAINKLPPRRKEVFTMRLEQNLSLDEIAAQLGVSRSAVEQHVYAATAFIRQYLQKHAEIKVLLLVFLSLYDY